MKNLVLASASVLALGLVGAGIGHAANTPNYHNSTNMPQSGAQQPGSTTMQQGAQAQIPPANARAQNASVRLSRNQIKQVQQQLKSAGLYKGKVDGKMGRETKQAVSAFQQQNGINQSGTLDQQTLAALNNGNQNNNVGSSAQRNAQPSNGAGEMNSTSTGNGSH